MNLVMCVLIARVGVPLMCEKAVQFAILFIKCWNPLRHMDDVLGAIIRKADYDDAILALYASCIK